MLLFTNPGSNLPRSAIERYGVVLMPQQIVAGGTSHDMRTTVPLARVDEWMRAPGEYPYVVGTTAPEMTALLVEHLGRDHEALVVTTSRKIIRTYDACVEAAQTVLARPRFAGARIHVVDSGVTDVGAGLVVLAAGEAIRAGMGLDEVLGVTERAKADLHALGYLDTLEPSVRGGRVGWARAWLANALDIRPFIAFADGEIVEAGRVKHNGDRMGALAAGVTKGLEGRRVWVQVAHGDAPREAETVLAEIGRRCEVVFSYVLPMCSSIYLHGGPGCVGVGVLPAPEGLSAPPFAGRG